MDTATGSPLAARQTALPYTVMAGALIGIGILFLLWLLWKILQKRKESPEYIEAQITIFGATPSIWTGFCGRKSAG